jgi:hypothetical protein
VAEVRIPLPFREALSLLAALDDDTARRMVDDVSAAPSFLSVAQLQDVVRRTFPEDQQVEADRVVPAILSLRRATRVSTTDNVAEAASRSVDLKLGAAERKRLHGLLAELLPLPAFRSTGTAIELLTQNERNYQSARVLTDIRPVFAEEVSDRPSGAVIVQTLQLQTWGVGTDPEMLHVAMDEFDLREIRDVIDRALAKTATLKTLLEEQDMTHFELDKRED